MKMTDGRETVEIRMMVWTGTGYTPDFADDFFDVGGLRRVEGSDVCIVDDVDNYIEAAMRWEAENNNNMTFVEVLE